MGSGTCVQTSSDGVGSTNDDGGGVSGLGGGGGGGGRTLPGQHWLVEYP